MNREVHEEHEGKNNKHELREGFAWPESSLHVCKKEFARFVQFAFVVLLAVLTGCSAPKQEEAAQAPGSGLPIILKAQVDRDTVSVGDVVRFRLTVDADLAVKYTAPELPNEFEGFEVVDLGHSGPQKTKQGRVIEERWAALRSFEVATHTIPSFTVRYTVQGEEKETKSPELKVAVQSMLPTGVENPDLRDIRGPVSLKVNYRPYFVWGGLGALAAAALLVGLWLLDRHLKRRGEKKEKILTPSETAWEIAYRELDHLQESDLISQGRIEEYYVILSDIVRRYIENRFELHAPERTTEEFLVEMSETRRLAEAHRQLVRGFLEHCDLVKFARYGPTYAEMTDAFAAAKRLVDETNPTLAQHVYATS